MGYILLLAVITAFDCSNDFTELRHNTFVTSQSRNKTTFAFHLFDALYALKSSNDKRYLENYVSVV